MSEHYLKSLFDPRSVVLVGASKRADSPGRILLDSLLDGYSGDLQLVNPHYAEIDGRVCYKSIDKLPTPVDLAIVVTPAKSVCQVIRDCGKKGIGSVLLMTRGIGRLVRDGRPSKRDVLACAKQAGVRVMGPRAAGMIRTSSRLNATYSRNQIHKGKLALVSKSGTLCSAVLDWAEMQKIGFSSVISYGTELNIDIADILDFLADDYQTRSIILQLDEVVNSRRFMSALRAAATRKPVVVMKSGHHVGSYSDAIAKTSDTRSMDDVFHAAISRAGLVRVYTFSNLFAAAKTLSGNLRTTGTRLGILSNSRGTAMMATDRMRHLGKQVPRLSVELQEALGEVLHVSWSRDNPVVLTDGCNTPEDISRATKIMLESKDLDALMVIYAPDPRTDPLQTAAAVSKVAKGKRKPVLAVWMGEEIVADSRKLLIENGIANYRTPEAAVDAFSFLCTYLRNQQLMLQIPYPLSKNEPPDIDSARRIINGNLMQNKVVLSQIDSRLLLEAFNIECAESWRAASPDEAVQIAGEIGYPVVLKIESPNITYKSDVNGVRLGVSDEQTLRAEYEDMMRCAAKYRPDAEISGVIVAQMYEPRNGRELMVRIINDPAFGPVISFGAGGTRSPALRDRAIQLPPLNRYLATDLINKTRVSMLLDKFRNLPAANRDKLREVLMRVSEIACELPQVFELVINPLVLDEHRAVVTDASVVIQKTRSTARRYDHLAIHPYPSDWVRSVSLKDGRQVEVRPVRPEDAKAEAEFVLNMSSQSKYFRFMHAVKELTPEMLSRFTKI
ncbi:MAG: acetate--CoA ligase family protein, partial [Gammaproteobacteria bacterium]|nr:acetate--CoA ligase family protein [Gammaproteobacteria bacterium]